MAFFSLAYVFSELGRVIATSGLTQVIARMDSVDNRSLSTIFWTNLAIAIAYVMAIVAATPVLSVWLHQPGLSSVLPALSVAIVINATGATHLALRLREFGHKTVALRSALSGLIGGGLAVAAAFAGFGVYSLIVQRLVAETIGAVLSWQSYNWRPRFEYDAAQAKQNLAFGADLSVAQIINLFIVRVQDLVIGASLGAAAVGTYRVAWRCTEILAVGAIQPFSTVALQTLSRVRNSGTEFDDAYASLIRACSAVAFPILLGYGVLAPYIVPLVFGAKWQDAGNIGSLFGVMAVPFTLNYFASPALSAKGNGSAQRTLALVQLVSTGVLTWVFLDYGLWWVAAGYVLRSYLTLPLQIFLLRRVAGITLARTAGAVWQPLAAAIAMAVATFLFVRLAPGASPSMTWLASTIVVAAFVYIAALCLLAPDIVALLKQKFRKRTS